MIQRVLSVAYQIALYAYPREFRRRFGPEMQQLFRDRCRETFRNPTAARVTAFLWNSTRDWIVTLIRERSSAMFESFRNNRRRLAYTVATAAVLLAAPATVLRAYVISGGSMEGMLHIGDHLVVSKLVGDLHHGDVIAFRYPNDRNQTFVKRVIGLPGDHVRIQNNQVIRNGQAIDEPYVSFIGAVRHPEFAEVVVPSGQLFVLGDNRDHSLDSRYWGFLPQSDVTGRSWFVYWKAGAQQ